MKNANFFLESGPEKSKRIAVGSLCDKVLSSRQVRGAGCAWRRLGQQQKRDDVQVPPFRFISCKCCIISCSY
jgi:hypothetical protein